ncbi:SHOCT domain-containing protein [Spirosoma pollinicola]|uniref:SHOCT domain-containing protein n=1 Tax=Spirosoma pollinicola TaxID=2057025 RepID=A0A2K8ZAV0_9BACT|nr:SHOCT domain-containing protein [Spirosoma pollinicola]AUD06975.1 hypothetical protein CWM47_37215 [Spirosoma pollinicola]
MEDFFGAVFGIAMVVALVWGTFYFGARVSKFTGKTYVFKDGSRITPQTYDKMSKQLDDRAKSVQDSVNSFTSAAKRQINNNSSSNKNLTSNKLNDLEKLSRLLQSGVISKDEFDKMKADILK